MNFRQGDTVTIGIVRSEALPEGHDIKIGLYTNSGKPLYEAWLSKGEIEQIDDTHFAAKISYEQSLKLVGSLTLRATEFKRNKEFVNAGENSIRVVFSQEPVNHNL